jgi:hypothetical protein
MTPNGKYLESGKPFDKFSGMPSREIFANWLLCVTANYADKKWLTFCSDPIAKALQRPLPDDTLRIVMRGASLAEVVAPALDAIGKSRWGCVFENIYVVDNEEFVHVPKE